MRFVKVSESKKEYAKKNSYIFMVISARNDNGVFLTNESDFAQVPNLNKYENIVSIRDFLRLYRCRGEVTLSL